MTVAAVRVGWLVIWNQWLRRATNSRTAGLGDIKGQPLSTILTVAGLLSAGACIYSDFICTCHYGCKINSRWSLWQECSWQVTQAPSSPKWCTWNAFAVLIRCWLVYHLLTSYKVRNGWLAPHVETVFHPCWTCLLHPTSTLNKQWSLSSIVMDEKIVFSSLVNEETACLNWFKVFMHGRCRVHSLCPLPNSYWFDH